MNRRSFLKYCSYGLIPSALPVQLFSQKNKKKPNIILIMVDDMGFSDPGCYGGEIQTPNIDKLAYKGLRFTQFYNTARCCPTRASLMTGCYPHQVGLAKNGQSLLKNCVTIAEVLKEQNYQTGMTGKWHLSKTIVAKENHQKWLDHQIDVDQPFGPIDTYPVNRGFDKHYGIVWGVVNFFDPFSLVDGTKKIKNVPEDYYITDAITEKSIEYIKEFTQKEEPFFLYIAHCAPHWPLHARKEDIVKYKDKYNMGWDKLREQRYKRQLELGLFKKENTPLPPHSSQKKWDNLNKEEKKIFSVKMSVHAAMVDRVDQGIGKVIETLKSTGQFENTIIFFLSDNGASPEAPKKPGYDRTAETRDGKKLLYDNNGYKPEQLGSHLTYTGFGPGWANTVNTPFRYWKKESYEGGCHTPLIVHWPNGLKTKPGSFTEQAGHVMDIMPTCIELAGAKYPKEYKGNQIIPLEGKSLLPVLQGKKREGYDMLFFEHVGGRAARMDNWKISALNRKKWELFNLAKDRTEMTDLSEKYPEKLRVLEKAWNKWAQRVNVPPPPKPPGKKKK